jgi:hypothetical protein
MVDDRARRRTQMRDKLAELKSAALAELECRGYDVRAISGTNHWVITRPPTNKLPANDESGGRSKYPDIPTEISAAVVQCRRHAGEILKILPRLSIDLRQRAKAANAAALVAMLLPDLSVRFWIYGLDDYIGRVAIPGPA